jgi:hypothetical protein
MGLVRERQYFQNQMHQYEVERQKLANATSGEYALQVGIAKNEWMKRRRHFEHNKLNAVRKQHYFLSFCPTFERQFSLIFFGFLIWCHLGPSIS